MTRRGLPSDKRFKERQNLRSTVLTYSLKDKEIKEIIYTPEFAQIVIDQLPENQNTENLSYLNMGDVLIDPRGNEHPDLTKLDN